MAFDDASPTTLSFDDFRLDVSALFLRKSGMRVRLRQQAARVLILLARRPGQVVTREELQQELWRGDTFVDFESGLNNCIRQIREALNDDAATPKYVETIPRVGYRFASPVTAVWGPNGSSAMAASAPQVNTATRISKLPGMAAWAVIACGVLAIAAVFAARMLLGRPALSFHERDSVLIADFENQTGDPRFDSALLTAFTVSLEQSKYANVVPRARIDGALKRMGKTGKEPVTPEVGREICQREGVRGLIAASITRTGNEYAVTAELIDPATGVPARSYSERVHGEDHILDALDTIAGKIRADLGESLYRIHQADRPLPQVTTASLSALKDYSSGETLWHAYKFDDAMAHYKSAVASDPDFAMAHAALGAAYCSYVYNYHREQGLPEYEKALSLSSRVTERERRLMEAHYAESRGHAQEADNLYGLYLNEYPDDWVARWDYARFLRMHGEYEEGLKQYQELVRIGPNEATTYVQMASAYKSEGKYAKALDAYSEAFRRDPEVLKVTNINRDYGFTLAANGEDEKAEKVFSTLASNPDKRASALDSLGMLDLVHGRYRKAQGRFEESLAIAERQTDIFLKARNHLLLAVTADGEGNKAKQMKELEAVLADYKDFGPKLEYVSLVGQEYARAGEIEKAEDLAKRLVALVDPESDDQNGFLRLLQGEIALAKGNASEAIRLFDMRDPRFGEPYKISMEAAARAYDKAGETNEAVSMYEAFFAIPGCRLVSWELQQRCVEGRLALASDYLARGDKQKALNTLAPLLKDWQDADANLEMKKRALELQARAVQ